MKDCTEQAGILSFRFFASTAAAGEMLVKAAQKIRETEETIRRSDRLIASICEVYRGFGERRV